MLNTELSGPMAAWPGFQVERPIRGCRALWRARFRQQYGDAGDEIDIEAIACENRYPARHFPEHGFNQMVVKAMFTGVALARILELEEGGLRVTLIKAVMRATERAKQLAAG